MKRAILTYYNDEIDKNLLYYQQKVLEKFNTTADYHPLFCKVGTDQIIHYQGLDYGVNQLFSEGYESVLILAPSMISHVHYSSELMSGTKYTFVSWTKLNKTDSGINFTEVQCL